MRSNKQLSEKQKTKKNPTVIEFVFPEKCKK